jgi:hypothetical protein
LVCLVFKLCTTRYSYQDVYFGIIAIFIIRLNHHLFNTFLGMVEAIDATSYD